MQSNWATTPRQTVVGFASIASTALALQALPKPSSTASSKDAMHLTLENLPTYCHEEGNCLIWNQGTNSCGYPIARLHNKTTLVHRYVYTELMGKHLPTGYKVIRTCGNSRCISPHCMRSRTTSAIVKQAFADGKRNTYKETAKRRANCIKTFGAKLSMELAREIRAQQGTHQAIAERYGVCRSTVKNIKLGRSWAEPSNTSVFNWRATA